MAMNPTKGNSPVDGRGGKCLEQPFRCVSSNVTDASVGMSSRAGRPAEDWPPPEGCAPSPAIGSDGWPRLSFVSRMYARLRYAIGVWANGGYDHEAGLIVDGAIARADRQEMVLAETLAEKDKLRTEKDEALAEITDLRARFAELGRRSS